MNITMEPFDARNELLVTTFSPLLCESPPRQLLPARPGRLLPPHTNNLIC